MNSTALRLTALTAFTLFASSSVAQSFHPEYNPLFDDARIATIRITMDPAELDSILAPGNELSDFEYPATFTYDDGSSVETVENVGFRLRGNTSRYSAKKSWKVSFNSFESGRKFHGVEKLNINGEHNDPSIIRSKLAWDLFQGQGVAASRAANVRLFINDDYYGLYMNVEHVDEQFLKSRFGDDGGNLYKCLFPADLAYLGPTADSYRPAGPDRLPYDLKLKDSDLEGYDDLAHFIDVLNNTDAANFTTEIEKVFNVNGFLRSLAVDVVTGSWDNYWYLKNNFYLYANPRTDQFEYIPYDFDNSFGIWWDGIETGVDWGTRDIYGWGNQHEDRPLATRILSNATYKQRFSFFIQQLLDNGFEQTTLKNRIDALHELIRTAAEADLYRTYDYGYTVDDFNNSFTTALGDHVTYGLKPFVETRYLSASSQLVTTSIRPILLDGYYAPMIPSPAEPIEFFVTALDDEPNPKVEIVYTVDSEEKTEQLFDDGLHNDGGAGDGRYAGTIPPVEINTAITFQFVATQSDGRKSPTHERSLQVGFSGPALFVNEIMASNDTSAFDNFGDADDWVELYYNGTESLSLDGYFLTDNLGNPDKWALPDTVMQPGSYLLLWLDDEEDQGPAHAPFKLSADGEEVGIYAPDLSIVDAMTFGPQETDIAYGRTIDGAGHFDFLDAATPGFSNVGSTATEPTGRSEMPVQAFVYPNPSTGAVRIRVEGTHGVLRASIFDVLGRRILTLPPSAEGDTTTFFWAGTDESGKPLASGNYFVRIVDSNQQPVAMRSLVLLR